MRATGRTRYTLVAWLGVAHVRAASRTAGLNLLEAASCWAYIPVRVAELLSIGAPADVGEPLKDRAAGLLGVELKVIGIKLDTTRPRCRCTGCVPASQEKLGNH